MKKVDNREKIFIMTKLVVDCRICLIGYIGISQSGQVIDYTEKQLKRDIIAAQLHRVNYQFANMQVDKLGRLREKAMSQEDKALYEATSMMKYGSVHPINLKLY